MSKVKLVYRARYYLRGPAKEPAPLLGAERKCGETSFALAVAMYEMGDIELAREPLLV
jgi:hypothetical protein